MREKEYKKVFICRTVKCSSSTERMQVTCADTAYSPKTASACMQLHSNIIRRPQNSAAKEETTATAAAAAAVATAAAAASSSGVRA